MPRVITLTDGPHVLNAPTGRQARDLQRLGYQIWKQFSAFSLFTNVGEEEVTDDNGSTITVAKFADDSEYNLAAFADHIAALIPDASWDSDRVADHLLLDQLDSYFDALRALASEAFDGGDADPKASSGNSPA